MQEIIILAAGMGSRLGNSLPKPLTELADGRSIMKQQLDNIELAWPGSKKRVSAVVGYRADAIEERFALRTVYNANYETTNTSKSLLQALKTLPRGRGVLWMNGDLVFHPAILEKAKSFIASGESFVAVNRASVAEEEVKYTVDAEGFIKGLSKTVKGGLGEAVGINYIAPQHREPLERHLQRVAEQDYFERAMEMAIDAREIAFVPLDVTDYYAVEVDFQADLTLANLTSESWGLS